MNVAIFDNGGETFDRYTAIYLDILDHGQYFARGMSENPTAPNGFGQCMEVSPEWVEGTEDAQISFEALPAPCQSVVLADWLDYIEGEIREERISYSELCDLQGMAEHIPQERALLREWAGVEEMKEAQA